MEDHDLAAAGAGSGPHRVDRLSQTVLPGIPLDLSLVHTNQNCIRYPQLIGHIFKQIIGEAA